LPYKIVWKTEAGRSYDLWQSPDLLEWTQVPGFPAVAAGVPFEHDFDPAPQGFFKIVLVEQAPVVVGQYPQADGFAVGRFADLSIQLSDETGIDQASIRLKVGSAEPLALGGPGMAFTNNTLTYDSGDAPLGAWGETVTATLVAADLLGNTLTHTWNFRLEPEPQVAANVYVFGSPTAQRAGQRVGGPAAALAARYSAPVGPERANDPPPWIIESVLADRIVIAYEGGGTPPVFTAGMLVCNLTPAKETEIFYRRVISVADDAATSKLSLMTEDALLTDFVTRGSATFTDNSVVYDLDENGTLVRALSLDGAITFPPMGCDLSGTSLKLREDGYEFTLAGGPTLSVGDELPWLHASLDRFRFWFTPQIRTGLEIDAAGLKSFQAVASGRASFDFHAHVAATLVAASVERTLYNLPEAREPKRVVFLGAIGIGPVIVPVFAILGFDFSIKSKAETAVTLDFSAGYRQEFNADFGLAYERARGLDWVRSARRTDPEVSQPSLVLAGDFGWTISLEPRIEFLVYGAAGLETGLDPSFSVKTRAETSGELTGKLAGDLDLVVGTAGPALEAMHVGGELSIPVWHWEWPLGLEGFALIPAGEFQMGDASNDGWDLVELPVHTVTVSAFYMSKCEVTERLWEEVRAWGASQGYADLSAGSMGDGEYYGKGPHHPVHSVPWCDVVKWCNARSEMDRLTPCYYTDVAQTVVYRTGDIDIDNTRVKWATNGYRLPTEAEWEKASRGGLIGKRFPWGDTISHSQANYYVASCDGTTNCLSYDVSPTLYHHPTFFDEVWPYIYSSPVGSFEPNGYGLYDMVGNIPEWCWDRFSGSYYASSPASDPRGPATGPARVFRDGHWAVGAEFCRVAHRDCGECHEVNVGFRLARSAVP
jgi:formylglycine-generating enzyme required for sulfatase activity